MKTFNTLLILSFLMIFSGCGKDDTEVQIAPEVLKSDAKAMFGFEFNVADNSELSETVNTTITEASKTISASLPNGSDIAALTPRILISDKASVSPTGPQDFRTPVTYTVTAEDGSKAMYRASILVMASDAKQIVSFVFKAEENETLSEDIAGTIDDDEKTIMLIMASGSDVTALEPTLEIPDNASIDLLGAQDFSEPVVYTVTAEDGSTNNYQVSIIVRQSNERAIVSFTFLESENEIVSTIMGDVDLDNKQVRVITNANTDIEALLPKLELSEGASYSPQGVQDFSEPVTYTITAADGTASNYTINVTSEREYLLGIEAANPNHTLNWRIDLGDVGVDSRIQLDDNGYIRLLCLSDANLSVLPEEIGFFRKLAYLDLDENQLIALPESFGQLKNLLELNVKNNNLQSVPSAFKELSSLYALHLGMNKFVSIPNEVYSLNLTGFGFSGNSLEELPAEIGSFKNLQSLDISDNLLSNFPNQLSQLNDLEFLNASNNKFEEIPSLVFTLKSLAGISFSGNKLEKVPLEIKKLLNLRFLIIADNFLTFLSPELASIPSLELLDIKGNPIDLLAAEICEKVNLTVEKDDSTSCN